MADPPPTDKSKQQDAKGDAEATIEGTLDRVVYANEQSAWSVVRLTVEGRAQPVTAVGNLLAVQPGEHLRLRGRWETDRRYGEQFRVLGYMALQPETMVGIEKYLGSGMLPGIGPEIAKRVIDRFGLEALEVIDKHPERLTEVAGIGQVRCQRITEAWVEQRKVKEVMVFLQSYGVSPAYAARIYKTYGDKSIARVSDNPYCLASDVFGIGFRTADRIASDLGIARDSHKRVAAGVLHLLGEAAGEGHVYCPRSRLAEGATGLLEVDEALVEQAIDELAAARRIELEPLSNGGSEQAVYLKALHVAERGAAEQLQAILATEPAAPTIGDVDQAVARFEAGASIELAEQQREAVRVALASKLLVITGGPGTGKTTIITGIIRLLVARDQRVLCCAPTGRAAKRMNEATGHESKTIHRLLEYSPKGQRFERDADNPLEADLLIVDEVSMVDVVLLYNLLKAVPAECRLVLVGDVDQLPSVGPGSVLADLIRSGVVDVVRLTEIFRQAEESLIVLNAHRVNQGKLPLSSDPARGNAADELKDFYAIERADADQALATLKELIASRIPSRFGVDAVDEIQVLTPMHKGTLGAANLNAELQALLNPATEGSASLTRGSRTYRVGDKVMQVRNNYDLDVFNGDIGRVIEIDGEDKALVARFDGREVRYGSAELDELVLSYACTIHKSQGSEYPVVLIPLHTQHYAMLQRNLLYTGITRGKQLVMVVGSRKAVGIAVKNNRVAVRYSRLAARLVGDQGVIVEPVLEG